MSSPSALPMNAKDSESKRGIIIHPAFNFVYYIIQTDVVAHGRRARRTEQVSAAQFAHTRPKTVVFALARGSAAAPRD